MQLAKLGAAVVLEEKQLTGDALIETVDRLTQDPATLLEMGAKARSLAQPDSLERIWRELQENLQARCLKPGAFHRNCPVCIGWASTGKSIKLFRPVPGIMARGQALAFPARMLRH